VQGVHFPVSGDQKPTHWGSFRGDEGDSEPVLYG
jgi:hypothetical protein